MGAWMFFGEDYNTAMKDVESEYREWAKVAHPPGRIFSLAR